VVAGGPLPADRGRIARALWGTVPVAAATEIGAVAVMVLGVLAEGLVKVVLLLTGPPLRYALVVVMVWYAWARGGEGPFLSVLAGLALVLVMPVAAMALGLLLYGRRGRSPS
jgi:hypothetical protein